MRLCTLRDALIIAAILLLSALSMLLINKDGGDTAAIFLDGELICEVSLQEPQEFTLKEIPEAVFSVRDGKIAITENTCPGQKCIHSGYTAHGSIVCLPRHIIVEIRASKETADLIMGEL